MKPQPRREVAVRSEAAQKSIGCNRQEGEVGLAASADARAN
jgi:hypothetical protein